VAGLALALAVGTASARELDAPRVLERVQAWLDETRDLKARFEQALISGAFGAGLSESGSMVLARPGRMRWDYMDPEVKVALVEGDRTSLYIEEDGQMWEGRLDEAETLLPSLLAGEERLELLFTATLESGPEGSGRGVYRLRLVPRGTSDTFEGVVLTLRHPLYALEEVEVLDLAGNRMRYRFFEIERNTGLPPAAFRFEPPPGTEILSGAVTAPGP
jgi:outer membrane lipoprotein carrier protein